MKTRLQRFTSALPKLLLLFLLTGMEHCEGCDDIVLLNYRNADSKCLSHVSLLTTANESAFLFPGERASFIVPKGQHRVRVILGDCLTSADVEPPSGCPCLKTGVPGRQLNPIDEDDDVCAGFPYGVSVGETMTLTADTDTNTAFHCDQSFTPALLLFVDDVGQPLS